MAVTPACAPDVCGRFGDGHRTHPIRARRTGETPWGWRDAVVSAVDGGAASVRYLDHEDELSLWHHADLPLAVGDPVRVHEEFRILDTGSGWHCVAVSGGAGPVSEPAHPDLSAAEASPTVVDLATGDAAAVDRQDGPE